MSGIIGKFVKVKTKTLHDTFGECVYEITGPTREQDTPQGRRTFVKCVMLGGSGPSARHGLEVWDELSALEASVAAGVVHKEIPPQEAEALKKAFADKGSKKSAPGGVIEM